MAKEAKRALAEEKKLQKQIEKAEKAYERESKKVFSEKHSVSFGHVYFDERLRDLEGELKQDDIFKKVGESAKMHFKSFATSKYAKVEVKREVPIEPTGSVISDTLATTQMAEQVFYVVRSDQVDQFVKYDLHRRDCFIIDSSNENTTTSTIKALWAARVKDSSLNYETGHFLETSTDRPLVEVICTSIKSILRRPAALQRDVSEITDKVRVKAPGADVDQLWLRMLLTIDGITEIELATVKKIIPSYASLMTQMNESNDALFEKLAQSRVIRGHGSLERSQRLGGVLAQRIINVFDDSGKKDANYVLH